MIPRLRDLLWVLALEGEVASDLSAYHRVDDMWGMGSRRWALLVPRLYAYGGAVQGRMRAIAAQPDPVQPSTPAAPPQGGGGGVRLLPGPPSPLQGSRQIEASQAALTLSDIGDMFSFGTAVKPAVQG